MDSDAWAAMILIGACVVSARAMYVVIRWIRDRDDD
jgi:hypothetical protein